MSTQKKLSDLEANSICVESESDGYSPSIWDSDIPGGMSGLKTHLIPRFATFEADSSACVRQDRFATRSYFHAPASYSAWGSTHSRRVRNGLRIVSYGHRQLQLYEVCVASSAAGARGIFSQSHEKSFTALRL